VKPEWVSRKHIFAAYEMKNWNGPVHGPYLLNIVGIRTADDTANTFNDWICFFRQTTGPEWEFYAFRGTTDPGMYWRKNPENVDGVAIVVPGQYPHLWVLGEHKGLYPALVQVGEIDVWRDNDGDGQLTTSKIHRGLFGINLHRASVDRVVVSVDKFSAGCQVVADPNGYDTAIAMVRDQIKRTPVRDFGYTLLEEQDLAPLNV
jgi:hypothetical protein